MIRSHHDLPPPVFAGFFPKLTMQAPPEHRAAGVAEIASVSNCLSSAPDDWINAWKHNDHGFYDTEDAARSVVPADAATAYDLYAYELVPVEYAEEMRLIAVTPAPGAVPADYEFLGYDVACRPVSTYFECSPLSCNLGANDFRVNRYCLADTLQEAHGTLAGIGAAGAGYEPGPYFLLAVHRKRATGESPVAGDSLTDGRPHG